MQDDEFDFSLWNFIVRDIVPTTTNKVLSTKERSVALNLHNNTDGLNEKSDFLEEEKLKPCNIDRNTKLKVIKGKYLLDDRLDLHGYNLDEAYLTLLSFIRKHYYLGNRCLLIITGHGNKINAGLIKNNFANWMDNSEIRSMILYYTEAKRTHGGKGAFYVLLRRIRKDGQDKELLSIAK